MAYGIKISLSGKDVSTSDPDENSLDSEYNSPKTKLDQEPSNFGVYRHPFASTPSAGISNLKVIKHGLGFVPMSFVVIKYNDGARDRTSPLPAQSGISLQIYSYADSENLYITINRQVGGTDPTGQTWTFKYYIFANRIGG